MSTKPDLPKSFFDLIQSSDLPVLVDFWAEWCGACRSLAPTIQEVAKIYKGRMITIKVNVDQKPTIGSYYQITGIPTLILFHKGKILWRTSGAQPLHIMRQEIEKVL